MNKKEELLSSIKDMKETDVLLAYETTIEGGDRGRRRYMMEKEKLLDIIEEKFDNDLRGNPDGKLEVQIKKYEIKGEIYNGIKK